MSAKSAVFRWGHSGQDIAIKVPSLQPRADQSTAIEYNALKKICDNPSLAKDIRVIRPIAYLEKSGVLITEWDSTPTLRTWMSQRDEKALFGVRESARWLRAFHAQSELPPTTFRARPARHHIKMLADRAARLPEWAGQTMIPHIATLERIVDNLEGTTVAQHVVHKDAAPANFLFDGNRVTALDLAGQTTQDRLYDYMPFMATTIFELAAAGWDTDGRRQIDRACQSIIGFAGVADCEIEMDRARYIALLYCMSLCCNRYDNQYFRQQPTFKHSIDTAFAYFEGLASRTKAFDWFVAARHLD